VVPSLYVGLRTFPFYSELESDEKSTVTSQGRTVCCGLGTGFSDTVLGSCCLPTSSVRRKVKVRRAVTLTDSFEVEG
jgi:hypothetical protein